MKIFIVALLTIAFSGGVAWVLTGQPTNWAFTGNPTIGGLIGGVVIFSAFLPLMAWFSKKGWLE